MESLIPPTEGMLSDWKSPSYYYENLHYEGTELHLQLAFNSESLSPEKKGNYG